MVRCYFEFNNDCLCRKKKTIVEFLRRQLVSVFVGTSLRERPHQLEKIEGDVGRGPGAGGNGLCQVDNCEAKKDIQNVLFLRPEFE